jgi:hypothetical protein
MTFVATVLIGAGLLLIASALDDTSIVSTFQKIVSGQTIDWSGKGTTSTTNTTSATTQPPSTGTGVGSSV